MPHRPLTPATKALLTSMTIWGVIALALMLIELQQSPNTPAPTSTLSFVVRTFYPFTPLFLLSWVLGIVLAKAPQQGLRPRRVAALLLFIIMVALPLLSIGYVVVATMPLFVVQPSKRYISKAMACLPFHS